MRATPAGSATVLPALEARAAGRIARDDATGPTRSMASGLHGLALLRGWPFEKAEITEARMQAMRALLSGQGACEEREIDVLDPRSAYGEWPETYDEPNPLIVAEERAMGDVLSSFVRLAVR